MFAQKSSLDYKNPATLFTIGLSLVMLAYWIPYVPGLFLYTFIHMWRVEFAASVLLLITLAYLLYQSKESLRSAISKDEVKFIVYPILAFILWSAISTAWAPSWKSALHHTLVWSEYLIFYLIVRHLIDRKKNYNLMLTMLTIVFVLISIPAVIEYCAFLTNPDRATTLGVRYAKYGEQINTIFPLFVAGTLRLQGRRFALGALVIVTLWLLIFCSLGRVNVLLFVGGMAAMTAAVFLFKHFRRYRLKMAVIFLAVLLSPVPLHIFSLFSATRNVAVIKRLAGDESTNDSNNFRKLMASISLEMFLAHPVTGVGADNFGSEVNNYRLIYSAKNPYNLNLAASEADIPERAHNEYLQVLAELGIVGGLIFLWFLSSVLVMLYRAFRARQKPLIAVTAILGLLLFLASSLVSSFSFRFIQDGFLFFFVLAVGTKLLFKEKAPASHNVVTPARLRFGYVIGIAACLLLLLYSSIRVSSVYLTERAATTRELDKVINDVDLAVRLDDENPNAEYVWGMSLVRERRYAEAVPHLEKAVELGRARSQDFSYLATAQTLAGDWAGAERTFAMAAKLYPRSPFVLARYSAILEHNGKHAEAAAQFERARSINKRAANTWLMMINDGPRKASEEALRNDDYAPVMDLMPQQAIYAVTYERDITHPGEMFTLKF